MEKNDWTKRLAKAGEVQNYAGRLGRICIRARAVLGYSVLGGRRRSKDEMRMVRRQMRGWREHRATLSGGTQCRCAFGPQLACKAPH